MTTVLEQETSNTAEPLSAKVARLRASFESGRTRPLEYRLEQLAGIARFLKECESEIESAIHRDLGRPSIEIYSSETALVASETGPHPQEAPLVDEAPARADIAGRPARPEPDPSRAPGRRLDHRTVELSPPARLVPLVGAIAAGNCAIVKPSEVVAGDQRTAGRAVA